MTPIMEEMDYDDILEILQIKGKKIDAKNLINELKERDDYQTNILNRKEDSKDNGEIKNIDIQIKNDPQSYNRDNVLKIILEKKDQFMEMKNSKKDNNLVNNQIDINPHQHKGTINHQNSIVSENIEDFLPLNMNYGNFINKEVANHK